MNSCHWRRWGAVVLFSLVLLPFQNCGKAFKSQESASVVVPHGLTVVPAALNVYKSSTQVSDALPLAKNTAYEIRLEGDGVTGAAIAWQATSGVAGYANCSIIGSDPLLRSLSCTSVGLAHVEVSVAAGG